MWAALTLVQAWVASGKPAGTTTLGSYESWAEVLGGILEVAGIPGFLGNTDQVYSAAEQETANWAEFCHVWGDETQGHPVGSDFLFRLAVRERMLLSLRGGHNEHSARTRFGLALGKMRDRVVDKFRIRRAEPDLHNKGQRYRLELRTVRTVRNVAERSTAPESMPDSALDTAKEAPVPVEAANPGREKVPQPSATLRNPPQPSATLRNPPQPSALTLGTHS